MRNQTVANTYDPAVDMSFSEEAEYLEIDDLDKAMPANSQSRRLIEQRADELKLKKELDYLDGFSFDDDLQ